MVFTKEFIRKNLEEVEKKISIACEKADRQNNEVKIIAVCKNQPLEKLVSAYELGIKNFGENRIQDALERKEKLSKEISYHFIGHLQSNKAGHAVSLFEYIHSVDSVGIAEKLNENAEKENKVQKILLQVNIADEKNKYGFPKNFNEIKHAVEKILEYENL